MRQEALLYLTLSHQRFLVLFRVIGPQISQFERSGGRVWTVAHCRVRRDGKGALTPAVAADVSVARAVQSQSSICLGLGRW